MAEAVDVIIVGAGLSGLQAALDLHRASRSIIVLEARDRVGGKTYSVEREDGKGVQEIGAAWLNDTSQSHVWEYCKQFGLTPVVQNIDGLVASEDADGDCHLFPFGELPRVRDPTSQPQLLFSSNLTASLTKQQEIRLSRFAV
jgi:monoamine oxidase